jgi:hypothetical protein
MKNKLMYVSTLLLAGVLLLGTNGCKKDDPTALSLVNLKAGSVDLNGAVAATTVPTNPTIVAEFTTSVDPATATSSNITMTRDYDNANVVITITTSANMVTIVPTEVLASGALYKLNFGAGLKSTDAQPLTATSRAFTTIGAFAPSGMIAYWNFEDNAVDQVTTKDASAKIDVTYTASRNAAAGKAATFNGTTSIIEIPNGDALLNSTNFTIGFWVKANSTGQVDAGGNPKGHFVLGLGAYKGIQFEINGSYKEAKFAIQYELADGKTDAEDMWFPSLATDNTTTGWQGCNYAKSLTEAEMISLLKDKWLQVVYTYNGTEKQGTLYYNGVKMKSFDFDLWPVDAAKRGAKGLKYAGVAPEVVNELAFGFVQSRAGTMWDAEPWGGYGIPTANHFRGQLDDVRIYHKALTAAEIDLMYKSEKP